MSVLQGDMWGAQCLLRLSTCGVSTELRHFDWSMPTWIFLWGGSHSSDLKSQSQRSRREEVSSSTSKSFIFRFESSGQTSSIPSFLPVPPHGARSSSHQLLSLSSPRGQQHWAWLTPGLIWTNYGKSALLGIVATDVWHLMVSLDR